ncbi:MAG: SpvB/TcaC N-terminal domain-containing protein, partial [Gammaproteobacteria bacterium]
MIEHVRTIYRPNDLGTSQNDPLALLPLGVMESLALPGESYKLACTPSLITHVYGDRVTDAMLEGDGRYVHSEGDDNWWIPSGRVFLSPGTNDTPAAELLHARQHFFLPHRFRDPFHTDAVNTESFVSYDRYDLLMLETRDALGNRVTVGERDSAGNLTIPGNDYRVLQARLMMDPNRNRTAVAFDALGMVVGTAVMGKPPPEPVEGDSLEGFASDQPDETALAHLENPFNDPQAILGRATTRLVYDLFAYLRTQDQPDPQPAVAYTLARENHDADLVSGQQTLIQHSFSYSDGFGREIQKKIQAEPGPVPRRDENGEIIVGPDGQPEMTPNDVSRRWVGSGWIVFNNKGKPVRQYEPFFTDTHRFDFDVRIGVSPIIFYDPVERVVATLHPNHTWEKVIFDPWRQETWDVNDTLLIANPAEDPDAGSFFQRLANGEYLPTWHDRRAGGALGSREQAAASKTALHAETPAIVHFDTLGRPFLTIAHNRLPLPPGEGGGEGEGNESPATGADEFYATRVELDIEGNQRAVRDATVQAGDPPGRIVMFYDYDMLGTQIHSASMEAGERWMLNDVAGQPIHAWNSRGHAFRTEYDALHRPVRSFVQGSDPGNPAGEILFGRTEFGEDQPNATALNLRTRAFRVFDTAGVVTSELYDFKGNPLSGSRQLAADYHASPDWS